VCAAALRSNVTEPYIPWRLKRGDIENTIFKILLETSLIVSTEVVTGKEVTQYLSVEKVSQYSMAIDALVRQLGTSLEGMQEEILSLDSSALIKWIDLSAKGEEEDREFPIERRVIGVFEGIEQVFSIYTDEYLGRKRFLVLTTNEKYDDELMNRLLVAERDIRLQFKDAPLSFEYIPKLLDALGQVLNPNVRLIWSRSLDGISTSSFATSTT
jgi:hypothetical protein